MEGMRKSIHSMNSLQKEIYRYQMQVAELEDKTSQLQVENQYLLTVLNNVSDIVYRLDKNGNITYISNSIQRYGYDPRTLLGTQLLDLIHPEDRKSAIYIAKERRTGERRARNKKLRLIPADESDQLIGIIHPVFLFSSEGLYRMEQDEEQFTGTHGIAKDITDHESVKEELLLARDRLQTILDTVPGNISWISSDMSYLGVNKNLAAQFDKSPEEFIGAKAGFESRTSEFATLIRLFFKADSSRFEKEVSLLQNEVIKHYLFAGQKYKNDRAAVFVSIDISKLKQSEERTRVVLNEKVELLQEVHHRVNNNLQILMCLLDMQVASGVHPEMQTFFMSFQCRIWSMLTIHELVCRNPNSDQVPVSEYFESLFKFYISKGFLNPAQISVNLDVEIFEVQVSQLVPLGIIANELICNALQHGFPDSRPGCLDVKLHVKNTNDTELTVSDDGVGIPTGLDMKTSDTNGFQLIGSLAEQIEGTVYWDRDQGTQFRLEFPSDLREQ